MENMINETASYELVYEPHNSPIPTLISSTHYSLY